MPNTVTKFSTMAVLLGAAGCGGNPSNQSTPVPTANERAVVIDVESRHWNPVQVFLRVGASRARLGQIEPYSRARLTIPDGVAGRVVQIELRPLGSIDRFMTQAAHAGGFGLSLFVSSDIRKSVLTSW